MVNTALDISAPAITQDANTHLHDQPETKEFKSFYKTVGGDKGSMCMYPTRLVSNPQSKWSLAKKS